MTLFRHVFDIADTTDYEGTAKRISDGIHVKGLNAWLMVCSALLASIGLDTNSVAIIIGAMLISPLMSTILGVGYSVGVHDRELFIRSVRNLVYVTLFSLFTAVIYFLLTPLGEPTSEILARTQPTLLDICVALFGGIAGMISGSRKEKTNALPGVAIATALMPPLCASAFGLATGRWKIFGGAFYLFFINTVFIALSTYLIVKLLRFPLKSYVDKVKQRRVGRAAGLFLILISIPSFMFLLSVYQKNKIRRTIQAEIITPFHQKGNEILKWETENQDSIILVKTFFSGQTVPETDKQAYNDRLKQLGLHQYRIRFFRMNISRGEMDKMSKEMTENVMKNIEIQNSRLFDSLQQINRSINEGVIFDEVKSFYPDLHALGVTSVEMRGSAKVDTVWTAVLQWDSVAVNRDNREAIARIRQYLKARLHTDTVWLRDVNGR